MAQSTSESKRSANSTGSTRAASERSADILAAHSHSPKRASSTSSRIAIGPPRARSPKRLDLDRGYLSRTLRAFKKRGLIHTKVAAADRRQTILRLTARRASAPSLRSTKAHAPASRRCSSR